MDQRTIGSVIYTRRKGVVRGPYTAHQITRYLLLGRIMFSDELSQDGATWSPVVEFAAGLPGMELSADGMYYSEQLVIARQQLDERWGERRGKSASGPPAGFAERRTGLDRRRKYHASVHIPAGAGAGREAQSPLLRTLLLGLLLAVLMLAWLVPVSR